MFFNNNNNNKIRTLNFNIINTKLKKNNKINFNNFNNNNKKNNFIIINNKKLTTFILSFNFLALFTTTFSNFNFIENKFFYLTLFFGSTSLFLNFYLFYKLNNFEIDYKKLSTLYSNLDLDYKKLSTLYSNLDLDYKKLSTLYSNLDLDYKKLSTLYSNLDLDYKKLSTLFSNLDLDYKKVSTLFSNLDLDYKKVSTLFSNLDLQNIFETKQRYYFTYKTLIEGVQTHLFNTESWYDLIYSHYVIKKGSNYNTMFDALPKEEQRNILFKAADKYRDQMLDEAGMGMTTLNNLNQFVTLKYNLATENLAFYGNGILLKNSDEVLKLLENLGA